MTVIYIRSLLRGGAERQALLLSASLQHDHNVLLVVDTETVKNDSLSHDHINNIVFLKNGRIRKILQLFRLLKKHKVTSLICFLPSNNIIGAILGKLSGVKNILCGIRSTQNKGFLKTAIMKFICNVLNIQFISNSYSALAKYTDLGFKAMNLSVIHNGIAIPHENYSIDKSIENKKIINILTIGRFIPEKDYTTLLQAIKEIHAGIHKTRFQFVIAGYGPLKQEIEHYCEENKLYDTVTIVDGKNTAINQLYNNADIFVLTSLHEGMPNVVMEAMTFKLPVICTPAGDSKYLVGDSNGIIFHFGNYKELADALILLANDSHKFKMMSENSFKKIQEQFNIEKFVSSYSSKLIYEN